jgi:hypothetical protein
MNTQRWVEVERLPDINQSGAGRSLGSNTGEPLERVQGDGDEEGRTPSEWERQDFNEWYVLAVQFKLVTDYQWRESEYWVLVNGLWRGFCEMVGMFSGAWLRRKLALGEDSVL